MKKEMFKQIALYNFLAIALAINLTACAQQSDNAAAMQNKSAINNQTNERAANHESNQNTKTAAASGEKQATGGEKQAAKNQCTTWTDVVAADKAKKIYASSDYQAMPELPAGFKNGCVYNNHLFDPRTLTLMVLKDGLRITPAAANDDINGIIPNYNLDEGEKLEKKGQTLEIDFYADDETTAAAGGDSNVDHARINKKDNTVFLGYESMQSSGAPLTEMAGLLEATTKGRPRRQTK